MDEFKEPHRPAGHEQDALLQEIRKIVQESADETAKRLLDRIEALARTIPTKDTKGE